MIGKDWIGKDWDGTVDVIYMTRRQKEREQSEPKKTEIPVPCPHCGQFMTVGIVKGKDPKLGEDG